MKKLPLHLGVCLGIVFLTVRVSGQVRADYDTLVHQGNTQLQSGSNDLALSTAQSAIKLNADRWEAYALAGGALINLKRYEDAADNISHAIDHAPAAKQLGLRDLRRQCFAAEAGTPANPVPAPAAAVSSATTQSEIVLWKSIESSASPEDFQAYLKAYPQGAFAPLAQRHLAELQAQAEQAQWKAIENSSNPADFQAYLKQYPNGAFVTQAQSNLADAEKAQAERIAQERQTSVWTDARTSLMWTKHDNGANVTWKQALDYCSTLRLAEYSDWRLPTLAEFQGFYDAGVKLNKVERAVLQLSGFEHN